MIYKVHISTEYIIEAEDDISAIYVAKDFLFRDTDISYHQLHRFHFEPIKLEEDDKDN